MQEVGDRDRGPRPEPLHRLRRARPDLHRIRQALPRPRHASGSRSSSCSATAPPPSAPCAAAKAQLADLIRNSNAVFQTTAKRDRDIEALFRAFPTFEDESRLTLDRLKAFSVNTDPLVRQLVPAAEQLSPTLVAFSPPGAAGEGLLRRPRTGDRPRADRLPGRCASSSATSSRRCCASLDPFLRNLNPILTGLGLYKHEITAVMANVAAATNAVHLSETGRTDPLPASDGSVQPGIAGDLPHAA